MALFFKRQRIGFHLIFLCNRKVYSIKYEFVLYFKNDLGERVKDNLKYKK